MNTLIYIGLAKAADRIRAGKKIPDGFVTVADCGAIEARTPWPDVLLVEEHVGSRDWAQHQGDGIYHYHLRVARQGVREIVDANGDVCGIEVVGTNRVDIC